MKTVERSGQWRAPVMVRKILGSSQEVAAQLELVKRSGRLVSALPPRMRADGQAELVVTVLAAPVGVRKPEPARRSSARRTVVITAAVAVPVVAAGVAVWWLIAHLAQIMAGLVLLLVVLGLASRLNHSGACPGLHCGGCKR